MAESNQGYLVFKRTVVYYMKECEKWLNQYYTSTLTLLRENFDPENFLQINIVQMTPSLMTVREGENLIQSFYGSLNMDIRYLIVYDGKTLDNIVYKIVNDPFPKNSTATSSLQVTSNIEENEILDTRIVENIQKHFQTAYVRGYDATHNVFKDNQYKKDLIVKEKIKLLKKYVTQISLHQKQLLNYFARAKTGINLLKNTNVYSINKIEGIPNGIFGNLKEVLMSTVLTQQHVQALWERLYELIKDAHTIPWLFYKKDTTKNFLGATDIQRMIMKNNDIAFSTGDFSYWELNNYMKQHNFLSKKFIKKQTKRQNKVVSPLQHYYEHPEKDLDKGDNSIYKLLMKRQQYQIKAGDQGSNPLSSPGSINGESIRNTLSRLYGFLSNIQFNDADSTITINNNKITMLADENNLNYLGNLLASPSARGSSSEKFFNKVAKISEKELKKAGFKVKEE